MRVLGRRVELRNEQGGDVEAQIGELEDPGLSLEICTDDPQPAVMQAALVVGVKTEVAVVVLADLLFP
jgi:hypothetical protein